MNSTENFVYRYRICMGTRGFPYQCTEAALASCQDFACASSICFTFWMKRCCADLFWVRSIRLSWRCSCGFSFLSCCCFGGSFFGVSLFGGSLFGVYFSCSWALLVDLASLTRALSLSCMRQPPAWQMNANDGSSWNMKQMGGVVCVVCVWNV